MTSTKYGATEYGVGCIDCELEDAVVVGVEAETFASIRSSEVRSSTKDGVAVAGVERKELQVELDVEELVAVTMLQLSHGISLQSLLLLL